MVEGIGRRPGHGLWRRAASAGCEFQQGFGGLGRQMVGQCQQSVLIRLAEHRSSHSGWHAVAKQRVVGDFCEEARFEAKLALVRLHIDGYYDFLTVSRISTNCAAPVLGCVSSLRRSAQW